MNCRTPLESTSEVEFGGRVFAVYQCDTYIRPWHLGKSVFQVALTFAMDEDGNVLAPESGEPLSPPSKPSVN
jgi:hypothetical protein